MFVILKEFTRDDLFPFHSKYRVSEDEHIRLLMSEFDEKIEDFKKNSQLSKFHNPQTLKQAYKELKIDETLFSIIIDSFSNDFIKFAIKLSNSLCFESDLIENPKEQFQFLKHVTLKILIETHIKLILKCEDILNKDLGKNIIISY